MISRIRAFTRRTIEEAFHVGGWRIVHVQVHGRALYSAIADVIRQRQAVAAPIGSGVPTKEIGVRQEAGRFSAGRGHYCGAHSMWSVGIDDCGNLQKCWEAVDKPQFSFGTAHDWDPKDPLTSASKADNLTMYLNTASPVHDDDCAECVWLPMCVGGCPHWRLTSERRCVAFRDDPEPYVLALHAQIGGDK